jgi:glycosyltransferase involved in cell wall biosynthesis
MLMHSPKDAVSLVTVGMPARNCEETLARAIRSVLLQTFQDWQLIVIDDGSRDGTLEVARQFKDRRITVLSDGAPRGLAARLNQILSMSRSKYFARMDGDDVAYPQRLERQVAYLEQHPDVDLVGSAMLVFGADGISLGRRPAPEQHEVICRKPYAGFPVSHPTFVGRLDWFRRYGYREAAKKSQDQDLLLRSYRSSRFANVPDILLGYCEDRIRFRKIVISRWFQTAAIVREFRARRQYGYAAGAVLLQLAKTTVDAVAVASRLRHRLLRHRARPISAAERTEWQQVWELVNACEFRQSCAV